MPDNPYQSPQSELNPDKNPAPAGILTEAMVSCLGGASPWIRFLGVLGYVVSGLIAAGGIGWLIAAPRLPEMSELAIVGLLYFALGILIFFPSRFTYRFGTGIRNYLRSNAESELELAFKNNRSLWKFMGILAIINLSFVPVSIIIGIIALIGYLGS
ncbi:MAG: hypothetical protein LBP32_00925 [Spirochaetaceae bacterium]|nr:hypothetical protein [Spirochaetaceae bacterium]